MKRALKKRMIGELDQIRLKASGCSDPYFTNKTIHSDLMLSRFYSPYRSLYSYYFIKNWRFRHVFSIGRGGQNCF
jgi:hypothetical protein